MRRARHILVPIALLGLLAAAARATAAVPRTITVQGTGVVTSVPNEAQFSFGVTTTGKTAKQALAANSARMSRVIEAIKGQGVRDADIRTSRISLTPTTNRDGTAIVGFSATNSVAVTSRKIATAGSIVDAAVGAGANLVGGPSLTRSDRRLLIRKALAAAVADARARAQAIASAAKVKLGRVRTVTEGSSSPVISAAPSVRAGSTTTPVEPGTVQTEENVTVTFDIS